MRGGDPDDVSFMERRFEKTVLPTAPDVGGRDISNLTGRRGVLTVSADLDRGHLLAELKGAVEEIGRLMDDIDELHAEVACLEEEIEQLKGEGK